MAIFLLELPSALNKKNGAHSVLVEAGTESLAREAAKARFSGDGDWLVTATALNVSAGLATNYAGCRYRIRVENADGSPLHDVQYAAGAETVTAIALALAKLLRGRPLAAGILDDGGSKTDDTAAANDDTASDVDLTPATPNSGDAFQFGFGSQFAKLTLDIGTIGAGTYTVAWEYWNGSAWVALTDVSDGTTSFKTTGLNRVTWTTPADWAKKSETGFPDLFYVRAKLDAGTVTTAPKATRVYAGPGTLATAAAGTVTVAAASDNIGDKVINATAALPGAEDLGVASTFTNDVLLQSKSDQGAAGAALTLVLRDNATIPTVARQFGLRDN